AGELHVQRYWLEARAVAGAAGLRGLVLPQEDADVLLVLLRLQRLQEGEHPHISLCLAAQQPLAMRLAEIAPRHIHRDAIGLRKLRQCTSLVLVARLGPGVERALCQRAFWVGY